MQSAVSHAFVVTLGAIYGAVLFADASVATDGVVFVFWVAPAGILTSLLISAAVRITDDEVASPRRSGGAAAAGGGDGGDAAEEGEAAEADDGPASKVIAIFLF